MSLVGTRPILQDELQKYELHHRARIAIKPGITGMWQVSGRSDITDFEEVVRLDPLLADTLIQTLIYYHTRMKVESELVNIFNIPHTEGQVLLLADIIQKAFRPAVGATQEQKDKARNNRVFFTSRKTLLNEFNHFEGNMNIFQPAIDITEAALQKEVADIESKLMQLRAEMR